MHADQNFLSIKRRYSSLSLFLPGMLYQGQGTSQLLAGRVDGVLCVPNTTQHKTEQDSSVTRRSNIDAHTLSVMQA